MARRVASQRRSMPSAGWRQVGAALALCGVVVAGSGCASLGPDPSLVRVAIPHRPPVKLLDVEHEGKTYVVIDEATWTALDAYMRALVTGLEGVCVGSGQAELPRGWREAGGTGLEAARVAVARSCYSE